MKTTLLALLVLSCVAARAQANPCCYEEDSYHLFSNVDGSVAPILLVGTALLVADTAFLIVDVSYAIRGKRASVEYSVYELLFAGANVAAGLALDEKPATTIAVTLGAGMATHAVLSMVWPRAESGVTVQPTTVGAKGYGVGLSGRF